MNKLFFFRLPKAGGTSLSTAIAVNFGPARVAPNIENDIQDHLANQGNYERFRGYDFYSGHYGADIFNAVGDGHLRVTNFRHPVEPVYSLYRYFSQVEFEEVTLGERKHAAVKPAKTLSRKDFVASPYEVVQTYVSNQQARQLTGSSWALQAKISMDAAHAQLIERVAFTCVSTLTYPKSGLGHRSVFL